MKEKMKTLLFVTTLVAFSLAVSIATAPPAWACSSTCEPFYCGGGGGVAWLVDRNSPQDDFAYGSGPIVCTNPNYIVAYVWCQQYPCGIEGTGKLFMGGETPMEFSVERKQQDQLDTFMAAETTKTLSSAEIKNRLLGMGLKFVREVPVTAPSNLSR